MDSSSGAGDHELRFGILGPLRITVHGLEVGLDSPKQRGLLGALLIDVGTVWSVDRLAEILWGADRPADPSAAVQTHISRLRSHLGRVGGPKARDMVATRPRGYVLDVAAESVDAGRFERRVAQARAATAPDTAADLLAEGLELWRGRPFEGFDDAYTRAEASRLEELRSTAAELRADALLAMERYADAANELEAAVARAPLREHLHARLMVALASSGRVAEALAAYRELRDLLVEELGVEPSADLRRLERAILQQDEHLSWPASFTWDEDRPATPGGGRAGVAAVAPRDVLPESLTSFVGREEDLQGVVAALAEARVVVLTGVGGVGKSRLAVQVAREVVGAYQDGIDLCDLTGAADSASVPDVVATTLGVMPAEGAESQEALTDLLRTQRRLVVLDNCEHVLAGVSELVDRIVRRCPHVAVLATSRQPLAVAGAQIWPVQPLEIGERSDGAAVGLFRDRAAAVAPDFTLAEDTREVVAEICRRLDGLPLAVELAAVRVRSMTPADIAERLDDRFALLTAEPLAGSPRHQSLRAVVDWSYGMLSEETRRLFDRVSVFAGGFGLRAAEQVCAGDGLGPDEVAGRLAELVDHSLVAVDRSGRHVRYRVLETLRTYGRARLEERGELAIWQRRHAEHFTEVAEGAAVGLHTAEESFWTRLVDAEFANLRAAHAWACSAGEVAFALRLPAGLREYAYYRLRDEVYDWALRSLSLPDAAASPSYPGALVVAGIGWIQRGELAHAEAIGADVLANAADDGVLFRARRSLAEVALYRGNLDETERRGQDIVARARAVGRPYDEAMGHLYRVHAAAYAGRPEDALQRLEAGWRAAEKVGAPTLLAGFWFLEGEVRLDTDPAAARSAYRQAREHARSVGNRFIEGVARVAAASLEARHGEPADALSAFGAVIDHWRRSGDWAHMWTTLRNLVVLFDRVAATHSAAVLLGAVATAATGAAAFGADAARLDMVATSLREALGDEGFAAAEARGRDMGDDEAVRFALAEIDGLLAAGLPDVSRA